MRYGYNLAAANAKARRLNDVLPALYDEFNAELTRSGKILTLTEAKDRIEELTEEILGELDAGA